MESLHFHSPVQFLLTCTMLGGADHIHTPCCVPLCCSLRDVLAL